MKSSYSPVQFLKLLLLAVIMSGCATLHRPDVIPAAETNRYSEEVFYNDQGLKLFARTWNPEGSARANIVILHGTALHSGIYEPVAEKLTAAGYRVFAYDMQSWGRSQGKGADGYVDNFDDYAKDLYRVLNKMRIRYPGTPNFVLGESLGGTVALYGVLKKQLWFDGIITSAAGYKPNPEVLGLRPPSFVSSMNMTLAKWAGQGTPNMPLLDANLGIRMVVENDDLQAKLLADPYVSHGWLPVAYGSTLAEASEYIDEHLEDLNLPILLLQGEHDMLVPVSSSQEIYDRCKSSIKHIDVYDSPHTVLLEKAQGQAVRDMVEFLNEVTGKGMVASRQNAL